MGAFSDSIANNSAAMLIDVDKNIRKAAKNLFTDIVNGTPILRGNLINDWHPAVNSIDNTMLNPPDADMKSHKGIHTDITGSGSLMRIQDVLDDVIFKSDKDYVTFTNSLPYAYRIEFLGWSALKAPKGMIRPAISKAQVSNGGIR